jgi:hypothetical protein
MVDSRRCGPARHPHLHLACGGHGVTLPRTPQSLYTPTRVVPRDDDDVYGGWVTREGFVHLDIEAPREP